MEILRIFVFFFPYFWGVSAYIRTYISRPSWPPLPVTTASGSDNLERDKFSPERASEIKKAILDNGIRPFNLARLADLNMNTMIQSRLSKIKILDPKFYAVASAAITIAPC